MDIRDFLRARWAEERADALAAQQVDPAPWRAAVDEDGPGPDYRALPGNGVVVASNEVPLWDCEGSFTLCMTVPTTRHVARWHPGHVLAELDAKEKFLQWCDKVGAFDWSAYNDGRSVAEQIQDLATNTAITMVLKAWAAPYTTHSDYEEGWKP